MYPNLMSYHFILPRMDITERIDSNMNWKGRDLENWDPHTLLVRKQNGVATLESSLAVPQKANHGVIT